jgi:Cu(I)/Ag(I) efflux system periplasmic protein CusF
MKPYVNSAVLAFAISSMTTQVADARKPIELQVSANESVPITVYTVGEIKRIDTERGTITLKHGPINNLGMPNMTMIFRVIKPVETSSFKVGDKVRFKADRVQGALAVTELSTLK